MSCRFGRKPILTCSYLLLAASGSGAAFSPTFPTYAVFRFLCGFGISGITLSTVILSEPQGEGAGNKNLGSSQPEAENGVWARLSHRHQVALVKPGTTPLRTPEAHSEQNKHNSSSFQY